MSRYPLVVLAIVFTIGAIGGVYLSLPFTPLFLLLTSLLLLISIITLRLTPLFFTGRETIRLSTLITIALLMVVLLLGLLRGVIFQLPADPLYRQAVGLRQVEGMVVDYPTFGNGRVVFVIEPDHIDGRIRVVLADAAAAMMPQYGDRLRIAGQFSVPPRHIGFDFRAFLARQRIFATVWISDPAKIEVIGQGGNPILRWGFRVRTKVYYAIERAFSPRNAGLVKSLLFGDRTGLPDEVEESFRRIGLMHLLAVSGLHLGILLAGLWFGLRLMGIRAAITYPVVVIFVLLYLVIVGPRVSLLRAALMFSFLALGSVLADTGIILRRWARSYQSLAAAAIVLIAVRPTALLDVGFQLSFAATAAIIFIFDRDMGFSAAIRNQAAKLHKRFHIPEWICRYPLELLLASAAAQLGVAPIIAYHFYQVHLIVLVANLLIIPLVTIALWGGMLFVVTISLPMISLPLAGALDVVLLTPIVAIVGRLAQIPFAAITVPSSVGIWLGLGVIIMTTIYLWQRWRGQSSCTL
ncbi:ComEC family competence protein [Candidatus Acetothermia bacterium]|nr:ComEC family competence protein [Candidatus Acetothermia bacterium]